LLKAGFAADHVTIKVDRISSPYVDDRTDILDVVFRRAKTGDMDTLVVNGEMQMRAGQQLWQDFSAVETTTAYFISFR